MGNKSYSKFFVLKLLFWAPYLEIKPLKSTNYGCILYKGKTLESQLLKKPLL